MPPEFARDPERLVRFRREARTLASLNHPNIAAINGLEESGDVDCLDSDHYAERSVFDRLMLRLRSVAPNANGFRPVIPAALRC